MIEKPVRIIAIDPGRIDTEWDVAIAAAFRAEWNASVYYVQYGTVEYLENFGKFIGVSGVDDAPGSRAAGMLLEQLHEAHGETKFEIIFMTDWRLGDAFDFAKTLQAAGHNFHVVSLARPTDYLLSFSNEDEYNECEARKSAQRLKKELNIPVRVIEIGLKPAITALEDTIKSIECSKKERSEKLVRIDEDNFKIQKAIKGLKSEIKIPFPKRK